MKKIAQEKTNENQLTNLLNTSLKNIKNKTTIYLNTIDPSTSTEEAIDYIRKNRSTRDANEIINSFNIERLTTSNLKKRTDSTINLLLHYLIIVEEALIAKNHLTAWDSLLIAIEHLGYLEGLNDPIITKRASRSEDGGRAKATKQSDLTKAIQQHIENHPQNKNKKNDQIAREITDSMYENEAERRLFGKKSKDDIISLILNILIEHRKKQSI
ncbi:hypothetical protein [Pseudomonas sp. PA27(2017)]|uniref:hypothetical protein n=1 Tax=Pseudomonas sp. PA27(2017) TaxID=1932112 RepID=UPI0009604A68|nr:hypothetical protein [Pseudomonas sp. PA27(2017)]OLU32825.1 hypothetical protein BVH06_10150 [Pseudomonas sp. PA27(2017)]